MNWDDMLSHRASRVGPSPIRSLDSIPCAPDTISLGAGAPDATVFPQRALNACIEQIMTTDRVAQAALQYGPSQGELALRQLISTHMNRLNVDCTADNILITNGAQQGIHLVSAALGNSGDAIAIEPQSYPGAFEVFAAQGLQMQDLNTDDPAKLIYVTPTFQNPTGRVMPEPERRDILAMADRQGAFVIEDDPYQALRYEGDTVAPLIALDSAARGIENCRVAYLGSFSKSVSPGLRLGWVVAPRALIERLVLLKQTEDLQPSSLSQSILTAFLKSGFDDHIDSLRSHYRMRRDRFETALQVHLGNRAAWQRPEGGFFFWLTLADHIDSHELLKTAAAQGVTFVPGAAFTPVDGNGKNCIRLSFSNVPLDRVDPAIARLARAIDLQT